MLACPIDRIFLGTQTVCPREGARGVDLRVDPLPEALVARFRLVEPFAKGDSGALYLVDELTTGRRGLLKVLSGLPGHEAEKQRLLRELEKQTGLFAAQLALPVACGRADDGLWFFREWVDGISLRVRLTRHGALAAPEAIAIAAQLAVALEELHRKGLMHRDLKPGHVMLQPQPSGSPKTVLIDAGVARPIVTRDHVEIRGTAAYLSPEQAAGHPANPRSDFYALGCVLFEMLSGTQPYRGDEGALLDAHMHAHPPPAPGPLPPSVVSMLASLMAKDPRDRPLSAAQILRAFEPLLADPGSREGREPTQSFETGNAGALWMSIREQGHTSGTGTLRPPGIDTTPREAMQVEAMRVDTDEVETLPAGDPTDDNADDTEISIEAPPAPPPPLPVSRAPGPLSAPPPLPARTVPPPLPSRPAPPPVLITPSVPVLPQAPASPKVEVEAAPTPQPAEVSARPPGEQPHEKSDAQAPAFVAPVVQPVSRAPVTQTPESKRASRWPWVIGSLVLASGLIAVAVLGWFFWLRPSDMPDHTLPAVSIEIDAGPFHPATSALAATSSDAATSRDAATSSDAAIATQDVIQTTDAATPEDATVALPIASDTPDAAHVSEVEPAPPQPASEAENVPSSDRRDTASPQRSSTSPRTTPTRTTTARTKRPVRVRASQAPAEDPHVAEDLETQAREAVRQRNFAAAAELYTRATQHNPRSARLFAALGAARLGSQDIAGATAAYERAAALEPQNADRHIALARTLVLAGDRARAADEFRRALALQPENQAATRGLESLGAR